MSAVTPRVSHRRPLRVRVGPNDHGRRMDMAEFARAHAVEGYGYELAQGVIEVTDIPGMSHLMVEHKLSGLLAEYESKHTGVIQYKGGSWQAKIELWGRGTERHPDLSIYLTRPPEGLEQPWDRWVPDIVVEIVSSSSAKRDYEEKPADYLAAGVREYWIIDPHKKSGLFLTRRTDTWKQRRVGVRGTWRTPLLPGFEMPMSRLFASTRKA